MKKLINLLRFLWSLEVNHAEGTVKYKGLLIQVEQDVKIHAERDLILDSTEYISIKPPEGFDVRQEAQTSIDITRDACRDKSCGGGQRVNNNGIHQNVSRVLSLETH